MSSDPLFCMSKNTQKTQLTNRVCKGGLDRTLSSVGIAYLINTFQLEYNVKWDSHEVPEVQPDKH